MTDTTTYDVAAVIDAADPNGEIDDFAFATLVDTAADAVRALRCDDCGRMLVRGRKARRCSDCIELIRDGERMDAGTWKPNGRGTLVFVPGASS